MTRWGKTCATGAATLLLVATAACGSTDGPGGSPSNTSPSPSRAPSPCSSPTKTGEIGQCGPGGAAPQTDETEAGTTSAAGKARTVHIGGAGDILAHKSLWDVDARKNAHGKGFDFSPMFTDVKPGISALDVAICHLETPLSKDNTNLSVPDTLSFNVPHEMADALKGAGFDGCDRVGNHILDRGGKGIASTRDVLAAAGLKQQGPSPTASPRQDAVVYEAQGFKIAHLAYGYTSYNRGESNTDVPPDMTWLGLWQFPVAKAAGIVADAKRAKEAGADLVVVSMHWGAEYSSQASPEQRDLAKALLASPEVDLILGTHVHVPQPCEKINGKYVVYGMGNFLSNQSPETNRTLRPHTQDGMIVDVALTKGEDGKVTQQLTYQPTHVRISDHRIQLATRTQNPEAYQRVTWAMSQLGAACDARPAV